MGRMLIVSDEAGHRVRRPDREHLEILVTDLRRGNARLILETVDSEDQPADMGRYIEVRLRQDNSYALEYRDGSLSTHFGTRTLCSHKVVDALHGWASGESAWQDTFVWNPLARTVLAESARETAADTGGEARGDTGGNADETAGENTGAESAPSAAAVTGMAEPADAAEPTRACAEFGSCGGWQAAEPDDGSA